MRGIRCQAHDHRAIVAEERHHLRPQCRGGKTVAGNMRWLCANAHSDTHYLLDLIESAAMDLMQVRPAGQIDVMDPFVAIPWDVRRTYGVGVRDAALTGWKAYSADFLAGAFTQHYALWFSSGEPRDPCPGQVYPYAIAERRGLVPD